MDTTGRTPQPGDPLVRWQRRVLLSFSALTLPFFAENLIAGGPHAMSLVYIKAGWCLVLISVACLLPPSSQRTRRVLLSFVAFTSAASLSAVAFLRGDQYRSSCAWLMAVPFCLLVLTRDDVAAAVTGSATTFLGAATILFGSSASALERGQWLLLVGASAATAVFCATRPRMRVWLDREHARAQIDALERSAACQQQCAQADRMALVGQLAAGVAHEINNPLAFVSSGLGFLEDELPDGAAEAHLVLDETRAGIKRIATIVGDLTAFARGGPEQTSILDLRAIVGEAERLASLRIKGALVVNQLCDGLPRVIGNHRHLSQVFLNLILNAGDELSAAAIPNGRIWVHASVAANQLRIDVDDNGPGIARELVPRLFTPFFTTKPIGKGTGLGLATSREYLRRAGGDLLASDRPGGGARFTLTLPLAGEGEPHTPSEDHRQLKPINLR